MNLSTIAACLLLGVPAAQLMSQCNTAFAPGDARAGTDETALQILEWDPDGSGPLPARIIVAGDISWVGDIEVFGIASLDPASGEWSTMAGGVGSGRVNNLDVLQSGELIVTGQFSTAGGLAANNVAMWDGQSWSALGLGLSSAGPLAVLPNGDVLVGGGFAGGERLARWNGVSWNIFGGSMAGFVNTIEPLPNGEFLIGGTFTTSGANPVEGVARWNGVSWSTLGSGLPGYRVEVLRALPSGDVVAAGTGSGIQGNSISRFDGVTWLPLGSGLDGTVVTVEEQSNGDLIAGGFFRNSGFTNVNCIARWDGTSWSPVDGGVEVGVADLRHVSLTASGDILAAGRFTRIGQVSANNVARFDGTSWQPLTAGTNREAVCAVATGGDTYCVGGIFTSIGGVPANRIARWNGTSWTALGSGCSGPVTDVVQMPNGDIIAAGAFESAGGVPVQKIARWDGTAWSPLGNGVQFGQNSEPAQVFAMAVLPDGRLVVGGDFAVAGNVVANNIAVWDGVNWSPLGPGSSTAVRTLLALPNGEILANGLYLSAPAQRLGRWDGASWQPLGAVPVSATIYSLSLLPNGDLVASGSFSQIGGVTARNIARWDGASWSAYGTGLSGSSRGSLALPNGDLLATGFFFNAGGLAARRIARWNGASWSAIGNGLEDGVGRDLIALASGDIIVVGGFVSADGQPSASVARLTTDCPAQAVAFGAGCTGSGGLNELTAASLPWLDTSYQLVGSGMPNNAIVVGVRGLTTTQQPLSALLPQGQAGCDLLVSPDLLDVYVPAGGQVTASFATPNDPALIAQVLHHQLVPFAFDANGSLVELTSSNGLTLTIGAF